MREEDLLKLSSQVENLVQELLKLRVMVEAKDALIEVMEEEIKEGIT
jgi:hypothetical protein